MLFLMSHKALSISRVINSRRPKHWMYYKFCPCLISQNSCGSHGLQYQHPASIFTSSLVSVIKCNPSALSLNSATLHCRFIPQGS